MSLQTTLYGDSGIFPTSIHNTDFFRIRPSDTRQALAQLNEYKAFVNDNSQEVRRRLGCLMRPISMRDNPLEVQYVLVIGRNREKTYPQQHAPNIRQLQDEQDILLMTYDSLIRMVAAEEHRYRRNILSHARNGWRLKHAHAEETPLFAYLNRHELQIGDEVKQFYKRQGYHMDEWVNGEKLTINHRIAESRETEFFAAMAQNMRDNNAHESA